MNQPTQLEQELYEALAVVIDAMALPLEVTKMGLTVCRFSQEDREQIETAYKLFSVIHGKNLLNGRYIDANTSRTTG